MNRVFTAMKISVIPFIVLVLIFDAWRFEPIMSQDIPPNLECEYKPRAEIYLCNGSS